VGVSGETACAVREVTEGEADYPVQAVYLLSDVVLLVCILKRDCELVVAENLELAPVPVMHTFRYVLDMAVEETLSHQSLKSQGHSYRIFS
jgi:hypothetical protein